jgi:phosphoglycolate phosphatase
MGLNATLVVFDLDGTLVDSSVDLANAVNAMLDDLGAGCIATSEVVGMVGDGAPVLVRRALSAAGLDPETPGALDSFLAHYDAHLLDHTQPYPGTVDTLEHLSGRCRLAVLTNKPSHATELVLIGLHLRRFFRDVIGGDSKWGRKPAPGGLLHLCEQAAVDPGHTLLVGDSPVDLATARNAEARICLARYGFGFRFSGSEFRGDELFIDSPAELVKLPQSPELP